MTQHTVYEATAKEFLTCFTPFWPIKPNVNEELRLHMQDLATSDMLNMVQKPTNDLTELSKPLTISDMSFHAKSVYCIMVKTLDPKKGPHRAIEGIMRNLLVSIMGT